MATYTNTGNNWVNSGVGQMGTWIDQQTGIGYTGRKKKVTDIAYQSQVGQSQNLSRNPTHMPSATVKSQNTSIPFVPSANANLNHEQITRSTDNLSPIDKFNMAILDMLQKAQNSAGNEDLYARHRELQRKQISSGIDYSGTEGLSPSAQENIANARAGEYSPEIDAIAAKIKANDTRLQNFESILGMMKGIGADIAKLTPSKETIEGYVNMLHAGASPSSVPKEIMDKVAPLVDWNKWKSANKVASESNYNQVRDDERQLLSMFLNNQIVKDYNSAISQKLYVDKILSNGIGGPADLALVYTFMKGLDPNSVVRESEYEMAAKSGNIFKGWAAKFNGYLKEEGGFLPPNVQTQFQNLVNQKLKAQQIQYDNLKKSFEKQAERQGLDPKNVVLDFGGALSSDTLEDWEYIPD